MRAIPTVIAISSLSSMLLACDKEEPPPEPPPSTAGEVADRAAKMAGAAADRAAEVGVAAADEARAAGSAALEAGERAIDRAGDMAATAVDKATEVGARAAEAGAAAAESAAVAAAKLASKVAAGVTPPADFPLPIPPGVKGRYSDDSTEKRRARTAVFAYSGSGEELAAEYEKAMKEKGLEPTVKKTSAGRTTLISVKATKGDLEAKAFITIGSSGTNQVTVVWREPVAR